MRKGIIFLVLGVILIIIPFVIPCVVDKIDNGYGGLPSKTQFIIAIVFVAGAWFIGFGVDKIRDYKRYRVKPPEK